MRVSSVNWSDIRAKQLGEHPESILPPSIELPVLPRVVMEFSRRSEHPNVGIRELAEIIETDSVLTIELLKHLNSAAAGLRGRVASAQHAIGLLGIQPTKLHLASLAVQQAMKSRKSKLINLQNFWNTNLERALFAREVAKLIGADADLAFAAGMLQDFLLPVVTNELYDEYLRFSETQDEQPVGIVEFERRQFQWDHAEAAARIMFEWGFPDDLTCCVLFHHRGLELFADEQLGRTAAAAAAVAGLMPDPLRQSPAGLEQLFRLEAIYPEFRLIEVAQRVHDEFEAHSGNAANYFSLLRRCEKSLERMTVNG